MNINRTIVFAAFAAFAAVGCTGASNGAGETGYAGKYVIAVDSATADSPEWSKVVEALKTKRSAEVLRYENIKDIDSILPKLREIAPRYVCFLSKPKCAGRPLVVSAARIVRKIDDDPYADAFWGILTGYEASDALRTIALDKPLEIRRIATSQGNAHSLDGWDAGFVSDEGNPTNFWRKVSNDAGTERVLCKTDSSVPMADAFNNIPVDAFMTSGHATEHNWQTIYNKNIAYLLHEKGKLYFMSVADKEKRYINAPSPKIYMGNGNCLIGRIDRRDCMATSFMHSAGVAQMLGYSVSSFYGYMGWGVKNLLFTGAYSLAESYFLCNQMLLKDIENVDPKLLGVDFNPNANFEPMLFIRTLMAKGVKQENCGMMWDRDTVAFYGDPAWRAELPKEKRAFDIKVSGDSVRVEFLQNRNFPSKLSPGNPSWLGIIFDAPQPAGTEIADAATGSKIESSVVSGIFALVPMSGKVEKGTVKEFKLLPPQQ